ncbi:spore coat protein U domain-containing protein [Novosphingobium lindaniclasticum]|uniref:Spore coat protein U/FanG domain-containing protein n=1 Tax=Novosphingobium lindaniclasticum LE124 TaxID=1096930 RepID=T0HFP0_9SPHN|nr:spore coat protein U domain-containing protein [Novosphingobium lindaniclasticum]EQB15201.1 hypothetical protein L284_11230 [Novosphingobium lindaniclasticum LE124]
MPAGAALACAIVGPASAATATAPMAVTATVQSACIVAATPLAFGSYDPTSGAPKDGTSVITVTCTSGTSFTVGLNAGGTSGAGLLSFAAAVKAYGRIPAHRYVRAGAYTDTATVTVTY